MPPSRTTRSAALVPAATIGSIPADVLVSILQHVHLEERHSAAALVCRRWREAANSPQLLHTLDTSIGSLIIASEDDDDEEEEDRDFLPRLRSLTAWFICKAARHVQQLRLGLWASEGDEDEARDLLTALLGGCGAGGQLTELRLSLNWPFRASGGMDWLGGSLKKLKIRCLGLLSVGSLQGLSGLQDLDLHGSPVQLLPSAHLPASLANLCMNGLTAQALPQQMASLSRLADLELSLAPHLEAAGYAPLLQLGSSLKKLTISYISHLPAFLPQLTSLESLDILPGAFLADAAVVPAALHHLTALTSLLLGAAPGMPAPPAELAGLSKLRRFAWQSNAPRNAALPDGPWLGSLQRLVAPAALLSNSLLQLAAAGQLEQLGVTFVEDNQAAAAAVLCRLPGYPSLRRVMLQAPSLEVEAATAALQAQRAPHLHIVVRRRMCDVMIDLMGEP